VSHGLAEVSVWPVGHLYSQCNSVFKRVYTVILTGSDTHAASAIGYQSLV